MSVDIKPTNLTEGDFEEVTRAEWETWGVGEGDSHCSLCLETVACFLGRRWDNPDVEAEEWVPCWIVVPWEQVVCDDCREHLLDKTVA
jgi:hypothetical protein